VNNDLNEESGRRRGAALLTITIFASYAIYGFTYNVRGSALPRIQADFNATELQLSMILALDTVAYVIACSYTAALAKKIGMKACLVTALSILVVSGAIICYTPSFATLVPSLFFLNIGFGMLEVLLGIMSAATFTKNTGTMLNLVHFFYGAGSIFSPIVSTGLMAARFGDRVLGWRYMYLIILSAAIVPMIPALIVRLRNHDYSKKKTGYAALLKKRALWLIIAILALGMTCEAGTVAWLANFLEKVYSYPQERAALYLTLFFACFTASRFIIGPFVDRIGFINAVIIVTAFAGAAITAGVLCGAPGAVFLVVAGIGVAPVFPTMMAVTSKLFSDEIDLAVTAIITTMGILMVPTSFMVGAIINQVRPVFTSNYGSSGVRLAYSTGYLFLALCCFGASVFSLTLRRRQKKAGRLV